MLYQFSPPNDILSNIPIYNGRTSPQDHVAHCSFVWRVDGLTVKMWPRLFFHSFESFLQAWYFHEELKCQTTHSDILTPQFCRDFFFSNVDEKMTQVIIVIRGILFSGEDALAECSRYGDFANQYDSLFHKAVGFGKVKKDPDDYLEELRNLSFKESEGERNIKEDLVCDGPHLQLLKLKKMNIGT